MKRFSTLTAFACVLLFPCVAECGQYHVGSVAPPLHFNKLLQAPLAHW